MKTPTLPMICGVALTAMSTAGLSHWWSVRQFIAGNQQLLATNNHSFDMQVEPSERAWEMVSSLRQHCRFPAELEMEVYSGVIGREAAVCFLQWCREQRLRPLAAADILDRWPEVAAQAATSMDALTM